MSDALKAREALVKSRDVMRNALANKRLTGPLASHANTALHMIQDALSALDQPSGVRVSVKPLEWFSPSNGRDTLLRATTAVSTYRVWAYHEANGRWFWDCRGRDEVGGETNTFEAAQAATQSHHEARILSALDLSAIGAEGWIENGPDLGASTPEPGLRHIIYQYYRPHFSLVEAKRLTDAYCKMLAGRLALEDKP